MFCVWQVHIPAVNVGSQTGATETAAEEVLSFSVQDCVLLIIPSPR